MRFHYSLLNKKFCTLIMKILEKRRGKSTLLNPLVSKKKAIQKEVSS